MHTFENLNIVLTRMPMPMPTERWYQWLGDNISSQGHSPCELKRKKHINLSSAKGGQSGKD